MLDDASLTRAAGQARRALAAAGVDLRSLHRWGFKTAARDRGLLARHDRRYALTLSFGDIEDQESSGRCWLFAPMVVARAFGLRAGALKPHEHLSETFLHFFNMAEKADAALAHMGRAIGRREPLDDDTLRRELARRVSGLADGGEWEWALELVDKYGLCPAAHMPETAASRHTAELLVELHERLGRAARAMKRTPARAAAIAADARADVVRILVAHLGAPPERFRAAGRTMTPREYARDVLGFHPRDWRVVIANPSLATGVVYRKRASSLGGERRFDLARLNVTMPRYRELVRRSLVRHLAVGFSGDVGRNDIDSPTGIMHPGIFDRARVYGARLVRDLPRRDDIVLGVAASNHAMAIVGVDVADRRDLASPIVKFRVVNSWGTTSGDRGFYHMYAAWFDENVFKIAVHADVLSPRERDAYRRPTRLPNGRFY
jgi:bleomycin hydrolase